MKKKIIIAVIIIFVLFLASIFIPVREGEEWFNDDEISDVGHYEKCYYNIYGGNISILKIFLKSKQENNNKSEVNDTMDNTTNINVTINNNKYNATIEDNETAKSFLSRLPQEFYMNELNGNEKYVYMDNSLPTNSINPKHIECGDIMLYGDDCLVIFYKSFDTNYSYTKIGHIDNLPDLGKSSVTVKFEK